MGVELIYPILPPIPTSQASNPRNSSFYSRKPSKENDSEFTISHYFPAATNRDLVATIDGRRSRLASACEVCLFFSGLRCLSLIPVPGTLHEIFDLPALPGLIIQSS
eukprot:GHVN01014648.1.p1 GENE.GHVN01014648.1~~GHVN01014648.1.p1  ORF type:complete len:107 (+),score=1.78 GHVN01014648.1:90-410(+)